MSGEYSAAKGFIQVVSRLGGRPRVTVEIFPLDDHAPMPLRAAVLILDPDSRERSTTDIALQDLDTLATSDSARYRLIDALWRTTLFGHRYHSNPHRIECPECHVALPYHLQHTPGFRLNCLVCGHDIPTP